VRGKEGDERNHYMTSIKQEDKVVRGSLQEIADMIVNENNRLIEPGSHNLLIYNNLNEFREIYSQIAMSLLAENEIVMIATQYDPLEEVKNTLRLAGVDVDSHINQGSLFIVDAQQGYQRVDSKGAWELGMSLLSRAKMESRHGVTWLGDLGSFFSFRKIDELIQYELWCPQKFEDTMKTICCYHLKDFENLSETQQQTLFDHHFKSIVVME